MRENTREAILSAARRTAQARGYGGLNFRDLAADVGIKSASIHYHFASKADLGVAVVKRYREDATIALEAISDEMPDPLSCLQRYTDIFRAVLQNDNRMCMNNFMSAEYSDLPDVVKTEIEAFVDVNVAWIARQLSAASIVPIENSEKRARAVFSAIAGAQLLARGRSDISFYDSAISELRDAGILPSGGN